MDLKLKGKRAFVSGSTAGTQSGHLIIVLTSFWTVWLTVEREVSTLRLFGLVLAFTLPALLIAW